MKKATLLFLCTANSCRSQMAEGWGRFLLASELVVFSAGAAPTTLDSSAVAVMKEVGLDISQHFSKSPDSIGLTFDFVVTVCDNAREHCPYFPATTKIIHKGFADPPHLAQIHPEIPRLLHYRRVRDEIKEFVETLPQLLAN